VKRIVNKIGLIPTIIIIGLFCGVVAYAMTDYFHRNDIIAPAKTGEKFDSQLDLGMAETVIFPGDTFTVNPVVANTGTEKMYAFVRITMPTTNDNENLYEFESNSDWTMVERSSGVMVFAYTESGASMYALGPEEQTTPVTTQMTMKSIGYAEYSGYEDISFTASSFVIGIEDISTDPAEAWQQCKTLGNTN